MIEYNFDLEIDSLSGYIVFEFYARWCGGCRQVNKSLTEVHNRYNATFVRVDVEKYKELAKKFLVKGVPTVLIVKDQSEVARISGSLTIKEFENFIKTVL